MKCAYPPYGQAAWRETGEAKLFLESADETRVVQDCAVEQGLPHAKIDHSLHDLVKRCVGGHPG